MRMAVSCSGWQRYDTTRRDRVVGSLFSAGLCSQSLKVNFDVECITRGLSFGCHDARFSQLVMETAQWI